MRWPLSTLHLVFNFFKSKNAFEFLLKPSTAKLLTIIHVCKLSLLFLIFTFAIVTNFCIPLEGVCYTIFMIKKKTMLN